MGAAGARMRSTIVLILGLVAGPACANIYAPIQPPNPASDIFTLSESAAPLTVASEELVLDLSGRSADASPCSAVFRVRNPSDEEVVREFYFVTPLAGSVGVRIDGTGADVTETPVDRAQISWWKENEGFSRLPQKVPVFSFSVSFAPGATRTISVVFTLSPGWDVTRKTLGPMAAEAAHLFNLSKGSEYSRWYIYDLASASCFPGGVARVSIRVVLPRETEPEFSPALSKSAEDERTVSYSGEFEGLPARALSVFYVQRVRYNLVGFTAGMGASLKLEGPSLAWDALLTMDITIARSFAVSVGLEADPLASVGGLAEVTFFPPGGRGYGYGSLMDVRGGAGVLVPLYPDLEAGFRLFGGARLTAFTLKVSWDAYLLTKNGWRNRITFMFPFSF